MSATMAGLPVRRDSPGRGITGQGRRRLAVLLELLAVLLAGARPAAPPLPAPPGAGRHRSVPRQMGPAEAGGQPGRARPGRALAVVPASRAAAAGSGV